jgi:ABC-type phosphate/phosphonate transport system substrate-binding protein
MPFKFADKMVTAEESCTVEDAMPLLEYLQSHRGAKVDLGPSTHLHTSVVQVLLAARPKIVAFPREAFLARWLSQVFACAAGKSAE